MNSSANPPEADHGEVVRAPHIHRIWAWIFPALAALAGLWLLWSNWKESGPEVEIRFAEAPGIQAGKTSVIYRGVVSGRVTGVRLDPELGGVLVRAQLKAFAAHLASDKTEFWIDQPMISIRETTGLDAIIQGNSIQARYGGGQPAVKFDGLPRPLLDPLLPSSLVIHLYASEIPFLGRGTPLYHRGVAVGAVKAKMVDEKTGGHFFKSRSIRNTKAPCSPRRGSGFCPQPRSSSVRAGPALMSPGWMRSSRAGLRLKIFPPVGSLPNPGWNSVLGLTNLMPGWMDRR